MTLSAQETIQQLNERIQELESKLKHATTKIAKLETQNKEYKLTIKDMDNAVNIVKKEYQQRKMRAIVETKK